MESFEKTTGRFQVAASALGALFALFNLVRSVAQRPDAICPLCFAAMLCVSGWLLRVSVREVRKGGVR